MTWPHVFAIILGGLAVIPVLYTLRVLSRRQAASAPADFGAAAPSLALSASEEEEDELSSFAVPRRTTARAVFGREDRIGERTGGEARTPTGRASSPFEYTILPHRGTLRQNAPDLGGFTKVPFLLYDRVGNCVMVHRRLSLN